VLHGARVISLSGERLSVNGLGEPVLRISLQCGLANLDGSFWIVAFKAGWPAPAGLSGWASWAHRLGRSAAR
jgi:hypothetical protein